MRRGKKKAQFKITDIKGMVPADGRTMSRVEHPGIFKSLFGSEFMSMPFKDAGTHAGKLVEAKNVAYGDAFAKSGAVLRALYPVGVRPDQYEDMLGICRVVDKLFRIATSKDAFGESPWQDIAGYGILGMVRDESMSRKKK